MDIHAILDLPPTTTDAELEALLTRFFPATRPAKAMNAAMSDLDEDPGIAAAMEELLRAQGTDPKLASVFDMI